MRENVSSIREAGIARIKHYRTDVNDPYYLHFRNLFADLEMAAMHAHGKLLDIGCGNKPYEKMFSGHVQEYVGCDVAQSSDNRVDVICPATELRFEDGTFDTVLCTQVIEHVADHRALVSEAFRVLSGGGTFILSGPMYWPLHEEPYRLFRFTEHGLRYLLEQTGFDNIKIVCNGGKWALCGQVLIHTIHKSRFDHKFVIRTINRVFGYLEDRRPIFSNTINYVVTAQKAL